MNIRPGLHRWLAWIAMCGALLLGACATTTPVIGGIGAPQYVNGDHWQYNVIDNLRRGVTSRLDVDVVAVTPATVTLHLVYVDAYGRSERTDEIDNNGGLLIGALKPGAPQRFDPPLQLYSFPLAQGKIWRQTINTVRADYGNIPGQILVYGQVQGRAGASVPAGSFDAVAIYRILQLDDDQFWRSRTTRRDQVLYSPQVKGVVREEREAEYYEIGGPDAAVIRTESIIRELVSFTPGM
jgi:hypothetical protein